MNTFQSTAKTLTLAVTLALLNTACQENDDTTADEEVMTTAEASDEMGATLSADVTVIAQDLVVIASDAENGRVGETGRVQACGISYDTTFGTSYSGTYLTFENTAGYSYQLTCSNGFPSSLTFSFNASGTRSTARLTSDGASTGSFLASGFNVGSTAYTVNGSFEREAALTQKTGAKRTFNHTSYVTLADFQVSKSTSRIEGGTATYLLTGESSEGGSFQYTASIVFNGDQTATISLNSGADYEVNLQTGQVTEP